MSFQKARNSIFALAGAAFFSQVILAISTPFLTRLYSAESMGMYGIFQSIVMLSAVLLTLRLEFAVPVVGCRVTLVRLLVLARVTIVIGAVFLSLCLLFLIFLGVAPVLSWGWTLIFIPLGGVAFSFHELNRYVVLRERLYKVAARASVLRSLIQIGLQVLGGMCCAVSGALLSAYLIANALAAAVMVRAVSKGSARVGWLKRRYLARIAARELIDQKKFVFFTMPAGMINMASQQIPMLFTAWLYSVEIAGFMAVSQRLIAIPMALVGKAVADVFHSEFSEMVRTKKAGADSLFRGAVKHMAVLAVPMALIPQFVPLSLYSFVLGAGWGGVKETVDIIIFSSAAQLVVSPVAQAMNVLGKQRLLFFWDLARLLLLIGLGSIVMWWGVEYSAFLWAYAAISVGMYSLLLFLMNLEIGRWIRL